MAELTHKQQDTLRRVEDRARRATIRALVSPALAELARGTADGPPTVRPAWRAMQFCGANMLALDNADYARMCTAQLGLEGFTESLEADYERLLKHGHFTLAQLRIGGQFMLYMADSLHALCANAGLVLVCAETEYPTVEEYEQMQDAAIEGGGGEVTARCYLAGPSAFLLAELAAAHEAFGEED